MSEQAKAVRKHRHEGPDVAHGPHSQERTVQVIQFILGCCIVLSAALLLYALLTANVDAPITD